MPGPRETLGARKHPGWSSGRWALVACVVLGVLALAGCNWLFPRPEPPPEWLPNTQTRVLDDDALAVLTDVDAAGTLTFSSPSPMLDALEPGDVIVLGVTDQTPFGLLRRATDIDRQGGRTVIASEQATLVDALDEGRIHVSGTLTSEDALGTTAVEGVELLPSRIGLSYNLDTEISSGVWVRGSLDLFVDFDFAFDIRWRNVDYVNFETTITQRADLRVEATAGFGGEVEKLIFRQYFRPFLVKFVVVVPVVSIHVGADGSVQTSFSAGVTQETSLTAGARYQRGRGWTNLSRFDPQFTAQAPNVSPATIRAEAYAKAELGLLILAVTGPYAVAKPYLELNVDPTASPWWELYGGLSCRAGVKFELTQRLTASYDTGELAGIRRLILSAVPDGNGAAPLVLLEENFERGFLDPDKWCYSDHFLNPENRGRLPRVERDEESGSFVLRFISSGENWRQMVGAPVVVPPLRDGDMMVLSLKVKFNALSPSHWMFAGIRQQPYTGGYRGHYGCVTSRASTHFNLGEMWYDSKEPLFTLDVARDANWGGVRDRFYASPLVPIEQGRWYTWSLVYTRHSLSFYVDGQRILHTDLTYYGFNVSEDWMLIFGDGNSTAGAVLDMSVDEVRLVVYR